MPKITNKLYRQFLDEGSIILIDEEHIKEALNNIKGPFKKQKRAFLICLFYTGARPSEVLDIKAKDITKDARELKIKIIGVKRGLPRSLLIPTSRELVKELWAYASAMPLDAQLFYKLRSSFIRTYKNKKGEIIRKHDVSHNVRYHFLTWFEGVIAGNEITPYFLRHSRFSKFAEKGATIQDIQMWKGSRDPKSVMPYLHMTHSTAKKMSRML